MTALVAYATYLPKHRLQLSEVASTLGTGSGRGSRVVASFDEDSTTMAVEAAAALLRSYPATPRSIYFATTSPAYLDKTRSEEHTSELQSRENLVCRLLLEKKKHI